MKLRDLLLQSHDFVLKDGLFWQRGFRASEEFEQSYLSLRQDENHVYTDAVVRTLPSVPSGHSYEKEWAARKSTLDKFMHYARHNSMGKKPIFMEVGCGNGWLSQHLASIENSDVLGVDVNATELRQAADVFKDRPNLSFAYADIFTAQLPKQYFDFIILAASIQYFSNIDALLSRLITLLSPDGEIHVLDSPFYQQDEVAGAQLRSRKHFGEKNVAMGRFYHHHSWDMLTGFEYNVLHDPKSVVSRILGKFTTVSPFPWVRIKPLIL